MVGFKFSCLLLDVLDEAVGLVGKEALDHLAAAVVVSQKLHLEQVDLVSQAGHTTGQVAVSPLQAFFARFEPQGVFLLLDSEFVGRDSVSMLESSFAFVGVCPRSCKSRRRLTRTLSVVRRIVGVAVVLVFAALLALGFLAFAFLVALAGLVAFAVILAAVAPAATVAGVTFRKLRFSWRLGLWFVDLSRSPLRVLGRWTFVQAAFALSSFVFGGQGLGPAPIGRFFEYYLISDGGYGRVFSGRARPGRMAERVGIVTTCVAA